MGGIYLNLNEVSCVRAFNGTEDEYSEGSKSLPGFLQASPEYKGEMLTAIRAEGKVPKVWKYLWTRIFERSGFTGPNYKEVKILYNCNLCPLSVNEEVAKLLPVWHGVAAFTDGDMVASVLLTRESEQLKQLLEEHSPRAYAYRTIGLRSFYVCSLSAYIDNLPVRIFTGDMELPAERPIGRLKDYFFEFTDIITDAEAKAMDAMQETGKLRIGDIELIPDEVVYYMNIPEVNFIVECRFMIVNHKAKTIRAFCDQIMTPYEHCSNNSLGVKLRRTSWLTIDRLKFFRRLNK